MTRRGVITALAAATVALVLGLLTVRRRTQRRPAEVASDPLWSAAATDFDVRVSKGLDVQVRVAADRFSFSSAFSYPGAQIGWIELNTRPSAACPVEIVASEAARIVARVKCHAYTLTREVVVETSCVRIRDSISGANGDVGIHVRHRLGCLTSSGATYLAGVSTRGAASPKARLRLASIRLLEALGLRAPLVVSHTAEHPTILVAGSAGQLGLVLEDSLGRLQSELSEDGDAGVVDLRHLSVQPDLQRELRATLHPARATAGSPGFVNAVRRDWDVVQTIAGSFAFFDIVGRRDLLDDGPALEAFVGRNGLGVVAFTPWLDYDNYDWSTRRFLSRKEYGERANAAAAAFRRAAPAVKCIGCMQSNFVNAPMDVARTIIELAPADARRAGMHQLTQEQMRAVAAGQFDFRDSLLVDAEGRHVYELYESGPEHVPMVALAVYPAPANRQAARLLEQAAFLLEDVRLDGIYVDQFNLAFFSEPGQRFSFDRWDGVTVDIDDRTGSITRRYADAGWIGDGPRQALLRYVESKGGTVVANTAPATAALQRARAYRFVEGWEMANALATPPGTEPRMTRWLAKAQLTSPIALGYHPPPIHGPARIANEPEVMRCLITFLRHGLLYFPVDAETSGRLARIISLMFPITPNELAAGWVAGPERVVTAISGSWPRRQAAKPSVVCVDHLGNPLAPGADVTGGPGAWNVRLSLPDWASVAVII